MGRKTVVILDEDAEFGRQVARAAPAMLRTVVLRSVQQVVEMAAGSVAAFIISDRTEDGGGQALARNIWARFPGAPIVLTGRAADPAAILAAFHMGACDYLCKPVSSGAMETMFNLILSRMGGRNEASSGEGEPGGAGPGEAAMTGAPLRHRLAGFCRLVGEALVRGLPRFSVCSAAAARSLMEDSLQSERRGDHPLRLRVHFLGSFRVYLNDTLIEEWPGHKARQLFAYLVYHHKRRICRDVLMDKFWPHSTPDSARNCLNVTLHTIRAALQQASPHQEVILFKAEGYQFAPELGIELDTETFLQEWSQAQEAERVGQPAAALRHYEAAARIYQGDFLEEFLYESWADMERENLAEIWLVIMDRMSGYYAADGQPGTAITLCEQILQKDNCREEIYRRLMLCHNRLGQRDKAIRVFRRCSEVLHTVLEVKPSVATRQLYQEICADQAQKSRQP